MAYKTKPPAPSTQWPIALKVDCTTCERKAGERYVVPSGSEAARPHQARMDAADPQEATAREMVKAEKRRGRAPRGKTLKRKPVGKSSFAADSKGEATIVVDGLTVAQEYLRDETEKRLRYEDERIGGAKLAHRVMGDRAFYLRVVELFEKAEGQGQL